MTDPKDLQTDIHEQDAVLTTAGEINAPALDDDPLSSEDTSAAEEPSPAAEPLAVSPDAGEAVPEEAGEAVPEAAGAAESEESEEAGTVSEEPRPDAEPELAEEPEPVAEEPEAGSPAGAELLAAAREWGYVDDEGNVRLKGSDRVVGAMRGDDPEAALRSFAQKFRQLSGKVDALEREMEKESNRARLLPRIEGLLQALPDAEAVGDLDALTARLQSLESTARQQLDDNLRRKEELCVRAEELSGSTDWKATAEALKGLQAEWKAVGPAPQDRADEVWARFRGAMDLFFDHRKEHMENQDQGLRENQERKEALCVRAEELSGSTEWKATAEAMKRLQDEWKATGPVPQSRSTELWNRFRAAMDQFFQRRKVHYDRLEKEQRDNFRRKEALCVRAEELSDSTDWKETAEALKGLQAEWKSIGPVPRKKAEALWERFHTACDRFFTRRGAQFEQHKGDRGQRGGDWRDRLLDTLERKRDQANRLRESLDRDEENLVRWRANLARLRSGPAESRAELEEKIADVDSRAQSKRTRLDELEANIQEISVKLT